MRRRTAEEAFDFDLPPGGDDDAVANDVEENMMMMNAVAEGSSEMNGNLTLQDLYTRATEARNAEENAGAPEENSKPIFEPRPLKSRRRERKALGKAGNRATCFLCAYVGERDTTVASDDVQKIVEMLRQNTGRMDNTVLAQQVADYYAQLRARVNHQRRADEAELPYMGAATVLEHLRLHQQDVEVKQLIMMQDLQELRETLMGTVLEQNVQTRAVRGNLSQIAALEKVIKLEWLVHSKQPEKMAMYSAGSRLNPATHKQGPVNMNSKTLFDYWNK